MIYPEGLPRVTAVRFRVRTRSHRSEKGPCMRIVVDLKIREGVIQEDFFKFVANKSLKQIRSATSSKVSQISEFTNRDYFELHGHPDRLFPSIFLFRSLKQFKLSWNHSRFQFSSSSDLSSSSELSLLESTPNWSESSTLASPSHQCFLLWRNQRIVIVIPFNLNQ